MLYIIGERLKEVRLIRGMSLEELGNEVGKSASTIFRYEANKIKKWDSDDVKKMAEVLETSPAYLLGWTDDFSIEFDLDAHYAEDKLDIVIVSDEDMSPDLPYGALIKIRTLEPNERLQTGSYYYIEFNNKKTFRMAIEDDLDGVGFMPNDMSERRIAYDLDYVNIIGQAMSMHVVFHNGDIEY